MESIKEISLVLSKIKDQSIIEEILVCMLTKNEVKNISSRWELLKLLDKGLSQRKIAKDLQLSLCKITRGSKELKKKDSVIKKAIQLIS